MQEPEYADNTSAIRDLERNGYTEFTTLIDTERHLTNEVAEQIAKLPHVTTVKAVMGFGAPETYTLVTTGFFKTPVVDEIADYNSRLSGIRGILKGPEGSLRASTFLNGKVYKWRAPTFERR